MWFEIGLEKFATWVYTRFFQKKKYDWKSIFLRITTKFKRNLWRVHILFFLTSNKFISYSSLTHIQYIRCKSKKCRTIKWKKHRTGTGHKRNKLCKSMWVIIIFKCRRRPMPNNGGCPRLRRIVVQLHTESECVRECETILTDQLKKRLPFLNIMFACVIYFYSFLFALSHPPSGHIFDIFIIHKIQFYYAFCQVFLFVGRFSFFFHNFLLHIFLWKAFDGAFEVQRLFLPFTRLFV